MKRKARQEDTTSGTYNTPKKQRIVSTSLEGDSAGSTTPRAHGVYLTPTKSTRKRTRFSSPNTSNTITTAQKADRSAKRKSATALLENEAVEGDDPTPTALAQEILDEKEEDDDDDDGEDGSERGGEGIYGLIRDDLAELAASALEQQQHHQQETPSKRRGRGRPKGSKNKRSPTPEGDLPPEERYFFQNRSGPPEVSNNTLAGLKLLTHDEYFALMDKYTDSHEAEKAFLMKLHARSFPQWRFEWNQGFNLCLYGWGSKRVLVNKFAGWLYSRYDEDSAPHPPQIVVVNGYTPKLNLRTVLSMLITTAMGGDAPNRLGSQPTEMLDVLISHLDNHPPPAPITVMINSIDSASLRRRSIQAVLARLAAHPSVNLLATADTPSFLLLWDSLLRDQFSFVFHDCTTYAAYKAELTVVDDVHELLGKKGRRIGGRDGIEFVLRSLTENSRRLYLLLLTEVLSILTDTLPDLDDDDDDDRGIEGLEDIDGEEAAHGRRQNNRTRQGREANAGATGVEYKTLYQRASENFVCSSEMNFRTLLKEFFDHEMIESRKDAAGAELLAVPLERDEIETLVEQLVLATG